MQWELIFEASAITHAKDSKSATGKIMTAPFSSDNLDLKGRFYFVSNLSEVIKDFCFTILKYLYLVKTSTVVRLSLVLN